MIPNVGSTDRAVRWALAVIFFLIALLVGAAVWKWVFALLGAIMMATALLNFCPIWAALKVNTRGKTPA
jgi:hypothetical protein